MWDKDFGGFLSRPSTALEAQRRSEMEIAEGTPTRARTIGGVTVQVPAPYSEGYVLSGPEADMLNQTFAENISNNMRAKAMDGDRQLSPEEFQPLIDEYITKYSPGVRSGGGGGGGARALTPVEVEVRNLATAKLKEILKSKGLKQKDIPFTETRDKIIEQHREALTAQAEKVVRAREKAAGDDSDILASVAESLPGVAPAADAEGGDGAEA
jgi:hypothetical protein